MVDTIRVTSKGDDDSRGQDLLAEIKRTLSIHSISRIRTNKVYRLEGIAKKDLQKFTEKVLWEPIDQNVSYSGTPFKDAQLTIEVAYRPGIMNPEVESILKAANDLGIKLEEADSSWEYSFFGNLAKKDLSKIIKRLLVNETIEHVVTSQPKTLKIEGIAPKTQIIKIRKMNDKNLIDLSEDRLFLNLEEMKTIQNYFSKIGRDPTDGEIEVLAQTWSEHCVHKTFKAQLTIDGKKKEPFFQRIKKTIHNNPKLIVSAFDDNSGVIDFYDGFAINGKCETHNSPSAIEPYGGAQTGSGGVFRDILGTGQGSKVIISTDIFCFAPPDLPAKEIPPGCLPPDYLLRRVVAGVRDYGNPVGIPTNNGSVHFHKDFRAKPTVAAGAYGIIAKNKAQKGEPQKGDLIVTIGGRTGRDGIHGATFSSAEMTRRTIDVSGSRVQIGNAIEEIRIIDAVLDLSEKSLIRAITDCGAGGYSSAIGEMGRKLGARVHLEKVPLKYKGLAPWEILLSESQERMILAISPKNIKKALAVCKLYNVEAAALGEFDGKKRLLVTYNNETVCNLDMKFLHDGLPQRKMVGKSKKQKISDLLPKKPKTAELLKIWKEVLAHGNVCSKEAIVRMYDHTVQGTSALQPLGGVKMDSPNDGAIIRPILNKPYGLVISHGLNPQLNEIDPYNGSIWAILEAVSNYVAIGGDIKDAGLIDNFIWPFPDEESLADLDKSVDACIDTAKTLGMPFVSGKDSLSSTYIYPDGKILKVPPVLLISVFGRIPNVKKTATSDFKKTGSTIVLVGKPDTRNLGGTTYFDVTKSQSSKIPTADLRSVKQVLNVITQAVQSEKILSVHDISEGGLATAVSEMSFGGNIGAKINLAKISNDRADFILFNETAATFLTEVANEKIAKELFGKVPHYIIGKTTNDNQLTISQKANEIVKAEVDELKTAWQKPMKEIFHHVA